MRTRKTDISDLQREFIAWLVDPHRQGSQADWAKAHDISPSALSGWKREDPFFQGALRKALVALNLDPESLNEIVGAMRKKAAQGDVQAAKFVLDYLKIIDPDFGKVEHAKDVSDYSNEELAEALEEARLLRDVIDSADVAPTTEQSDN